MDDLHTVSKDEIQPNARVAATIQETYDKLGMDKVISTVIEISKVQCFFAKHAGNEEKKMK